MIFSFIKQKGLIKNNNIEMTFRAGNSLCSLRKNFVRFAVN
jgi:hypothetical protein